MVDQQTLTRVPTRIDFFKFEPTALMTIRFDRRSPLAGPRRGPLVGRARGAKGRGPVETGGDRSVKEKKSIGAVHATLRSSSTRMVRQLRGDNAPQTKPLHLLLLLLVLLLLPLHPTHLHIVGPVLFLLLLPFLLTTLLPPLLPARLVFHEGLNVS